MASIPKIHPCLWYENQAEEAAKFYVSAFKNARIISVSKITAGPVAGGSLVVFELEGHQFTAMDGGSMFKFSPAVSFMVACEDQEEIDYFWDKLAEDGGSQEYCGWLNDRFGVTWQVVPAALEEIMSDNPQAVMERLMTMRKIEIAPLLEAAKGA